MKEIKVRFSHSVWRVCREQTTQRQRENAACRITPWMKSFSVPVLQCIFVRREVYKALKVFKRHFDSSGDGWDCVKCTLVAIEISHKHRPEHWAQPCSQKKCCIHLIKFSLFLPFFSHTQTPVYLGKCPNPELILRNYALSVTAAKTVRQKWISINRQKQHQSPAVPLPLLISGGLAYWHVGTFSVPNNSFVYCYNTCLPPVSPAQTCSFVMRKHGFLSGPTQTFVCCSKSSLKADNPAEISSCVLLSHAHVYACWNAANHINRLILASTCQQTKVQLIPPPTLNWLPLFQHFQFMGVCR